MSASEWRGRAASPGHTSGVAFVLKDQEVTLHTLNLPSSSFVLVARMTKPNLVSLMLNAIAIVTDIGGVTSHAATIAREFGIPCVVSTETASKYIQTGDIIDVDGDTGIVKLVSSNQIKEIR